MKMTLLVVVLGGVIVYLAVATVAVFVPSLLWKPDQTTIAHDYTEQQAQGRKLFYSNGCNYCHTQYVREEDTAMGPVSDGGSYVFDDPVILGSERTGPDLSYVGRKRSAAWEVEHLKDPRTYSPLSIMPSFAFLSASQLEAIAAYLFALGDRVAQERMIPPPRSYAGMEDPDGQVIITVPTGDQPKGWKTWQSAGLQEGKELYIERCLTCHGCAGNGLGSYGGTMAVTPADLKQEPFRSMPEDQWFWHVSEGLPGTLMPTWKTSLSEEERWKVIRYARQIFSRPVMRDPDEGDPGGEYEGVNNPLPLTPEALDAGKKVYIRECLVCHGDSGRGTGPYREGLQPSPPDFSDKSKYGKDYTDADYYWRVSEGLPWSAMPAWKVQYSEEVRWQLVHYVRAIFTQTEKAPPKNEADSFEFPEVYASLAVPESADYNRGKRLFLQNCAHCHGPAGDGKGWEGDYLNPQPADLRKLAGKPGQDQKPGAYLARLTFGIRNTAMPSWGEFLIEGQRWDAVKFLLGTFIEGTAAEPTPYRKGELAAAFATLSKDNWIGEGHVISESHGAELYASYCAACHGDHGQGQGPGTAGNPAGGTREMPPDMDEAYILWRIWEGVPETVMPPFQWLLSEGDIWDITAHLESFSPSEEGVKQ